MRSLPLTPRHTLTIIATEFASDLRLVSPEIVVRRRTVTVRTMATSPWTVWRRGLCGVRSRPVVSPAVKQIVAVRWRQPSPAPLSLVAVRIPQRPRTWESIATRSVTGRRKAITGSAVTRPTATVRATATSRWNVMARATSGVRPRLTASPTVWKIVVVEC